MPPTFERPLRLAAFVLLAFWLMESSMLLAVRDADPQRQEPHKAALRPHHRGLRAVGSGANGSDGNDRIASTLARCAALHGDQAASFVDYERLVYCTQLGDSPALARTVLVVVLVVLLYLLSSTADSFFCPILQAIVEKYRIPPDIAGVTFLSFGNGSPDVFSNIAAFSTSTPKIAVTSILGGGLLVTTVIAASVGLASQDQDQLIPRKFVRDVAFYGVAIAYLCYVFFDGMVNLPKALGFLAIYACYVGFILLDSKVARLYYTLRGMDYDDVEEFDPQKQLMTRSFMSKSSWSDKSASDSDDLPGTPAPAMITAYDVFRIPQCTSASDSDQSDSSTILIPSLTRRSSAPTPRSEKHSEHRSGSPPGKETTPLMSHQVTTIRRPASVCVPALVRRQRPRYRTAWESTQLTAQSNLAAKRWTRWYHERYGVEEFSAITESADEVDEESGVSVEDDDARSHHSECGASSAWDRYVFRWFRVGYHLFDRIVWNPLEFCTTFLRRLTIPLVDDEAWNKSFAMACPPGAILLVGVSVFQVDPFKNLYFALTIVVVGGAGTKFVHSTAPELTPPEGAFLAPYICLAFVMSVIWIMNIANEVLALLKVLGGLFGLSNSVLGVSVLAWGNSIGDIVSNTSIARDGFPTMAFAGCFAGPMFNLLVGIGLALTMAILSRGPISMGEPSPLVYVGFAFLFGSLLFNLAFSALDGFRYRPRLCYALIFLYASFVAISIASVILDDVLDDE